MAKAAFSESLNDYDQFPISDELPQETIASAVSTDKRWDLLKWNFKLGAGGRGESFTYSYKYVLIWTLPLIMKKKNKHNPWPLQMIHKTGSSPTQALYLEMNNFLHKNGDL